MDDQDLHAMTCKKVPRITTRHHTSNDIIWPAFVAASILAVNEPSGLDRQDGKCTDGLTLIPLEGVRLLAWDVTAVSPLAASYVNRAATDAEVADMAASRKKEKYLSLSSTYIYFNRLQLKILRRSFSCTTLNLFLSWAVKSIYSLQMFGNVPLVRVP